MTDHFDPRAGQTFQTAGYRAAPGEVNDVQVTPEERRVTFRDSAGIVVGPGCVLPNPADRTLVVCVFTSDGGGAVGAVKLGDRDDRALAGRLGATLDGGPGADVLQAGPTGGSLIGGPGDDELIGGPGDDFFREGSAGNGSDVMRGGGGRDVVDYSDRRRGVRADPDGRRDDGGRGERDLVGVDVERLWSGRGNDRLAGNAADNELAGGRGSDVLRGLAGDDSLEGRSNATGARRTRDRDVLLGGSGHDRLLAGDGRVTLAGGSGQDELVGGSGANRIRARDGEPDRLECFGGRDVVAVDDLDFVASDRRGASGRCERIARRGRAAALLASVGPQFVNTVDPTLGRHLELLVGCPADGPRRCHGSLELTLDGRLLQRFTFRAARGSERRVHLPISAELRARVGRERDVRLGTLVRSRDRLGRLAARRRPLLLTSEVPSPAGPRATAMK